MKLEEQAVYINLQKNVVGTDRNTAEIFCGRKSAHFSLGWKQRMSDFFVPKMKNTSRLLPVRTVKKKKKKTSSTVSAKRLIGIKRN